MVHFPLILLYLIFIDVSKSSIFDTITIFNEAEYIGFARVHDYKYSYSKSFNSGKLIYVSIESSIVLQPLDSPGTFITIENVYIQEDMILHMIPYEVFCFEKYEPWISCKGPPVGDSIYVVFSKKNYKEKFYYTTLFGKEVDGYIRFWAPSNTMSNIFYYERPAVAINSHLKKAKYRSRESIDNFSRNKAFYTLQDGFQLPKDSLFTYGKKYKK